MNSYKQMAIKDINSQANEQANASLQRIRGELAYMTPENFMFTLKLFISTKNKDVERKLDLSTLIDPRKLHVHTKTVYINKE